MFRPTALQYISPFMLNFVTISGVQSAGFSVGTSCERVTPLAEKNAAARHRVLRSLISLHNEHRVFQHPVALKYHSSSLFRL
jgi:hypothetical protein